MAKKLTPKQKLFVEYYLQTWNATQAAKTAGYSGNYATLRVIGSRNLTKVNIQIEIKDRLDEAVMEANEVLARLASMARGFDVTRYISQTARYAMSKEGQEYFTGYALRVDLERLQEDGFSHLIKKIKQTNSGIEVEWHDQMAALVHIGKHHKLFTDKIEHTGKDGAPIEIKGYVGISPDDWDDDGDTID